MLTRLFRSNQPSIIFLIALVHGLLWISSFAHPGFTGDGHELTMPLYTWIANLDKHWLQSLVACLFVLVQAFMLTRINTRFLFIPERSFLPSLMYIFLIGNMLPLQNLNPAVIGAFFLILSINITFSTYKEERLSYRYFEIGFILSMGSLFYYYLVFFIVINWISLAILRPFRWREWFFVILGYLTPYLFVFSYFYIIKDDPFYITNLMLDFFLAGSPALKIQLQHNIFMAFFILLFIVTSIYMLRTIGLKKIHAMKFFHVLLWMFLLIIAIFFIVPSAGYDLLVLAAVPLSYLFSNYFATAKRINWCNLLITLLIFITIFIQLINTNILKIE